MKTQILSENLKARRVRPERITQLLYSVDKGYSYYVEPDVWFDMVAYTSDSNDGVRSYHEKYHWLERFILPFDPENSSDISDDFHGARIEFELRLGEFIEHIEKFSELLKIRDLCKLLLEEYIEKETYEKTKDLKLRFWIELHVQILDIMRPPKLPSTAATTHTHDLQSSKFRDSNPGESYSSAAGQLQKFWARSINDEELKKKYKSK